MKDSDGESGHNFFRKRANFVLIILCIWCVFAVIAMIRSTVIDRGALLKKSRYISIRDGILPAPRGRIYDNAGRLLAWTELEIRLIMESLPVNTGEIESFLRVLKEEYNFTPEVNESGEILLPQSVFQCVCKEESQINEIIRKNEHQKHLRIQLRQTRRKIDNLALKDIIGECGEDENGVLKGLSGLEFRYDELLRGRECIFQVRIDKHGNWIPGAIHIEKEMIMGQDVIWEHDSMEKSSDK